MPPIDDQNTNQNIPATGTIPPVPPTETPQPETPPIPTVEEVPSFVSNDSQTPPPPPMPEESGTSAPNFDIPPVISPAQKPKGKVSGKTVITILGILFLVLGVTTGVILVKQQQDIRSKASCKCGGYTGDDGKYYCHEDCTAVYSGIVSQAGEDDTSPEVQQAKLYLQQQSQASCPSFNPSSCTCGDYTGEDGCQYCHTDCTGRENTLNQTQQTIQQILANDKSCGSGWYTCTQGCCQVNGSERKPCPTCQLYNPSNATQDEIGQLNGFIQQFGIRAGSDVTEGSYSINNNYTITANTQGIKSTAFNEYCNLDDSGKVTSKDPSKYSCVAQPGGNVYIGTTGNDPCLPSAGFDACTDSSGKPVPCSQKGLAKCKCDDDTYIVVTATSAVSCGTLCKTTQAICESPSCGATGGTTTTTLTDSPSYSCLNIKAYNTDWEELTVNDLKALKKDDIVRFTVEGSATSGTFDKAKFTINSVPRPEISTNKPGSTTIFYDEYTIPEGITQFTINAQVHHVTAGWM